MHHPPRHEDDKDDDSDEDDGDDDADERRSVVRVGRDGLRPVRLGVLVDGRVGADLEPVGCAWARQENIWFLGA